MKQLTFGFKTFLIAFAVALNFGFLAHGQSGDQSKAIEITLDFNDEDGIFKSVKAVQSYLQIKNNTDVLVNLEIEWNIKTDDWQPLKKMILPAKVEGNSVLKAYCPLVEFPGAGFYQIAAKVKMENGEVVERSKVVGINPEQIITSIDAEPDFDAFWENSLSQLSEINPEYKLIPQKRDESKKTNLYKVEMKSFGGLTVKGWLEVPKKKGMYPALLRVPGYSSNMKPIDKYDDMIVFSFNPRNHGESDSTGIRNWEMWVRGLESKENYFYRGIYLDCVRAVDFLVSREDVDNKRIAIWGGSQGGGLSFSTAALDQRIDLCIADIPWMCEWQKYFEITHWDEIDVWFSQNPRQNWQTMLQTFSYFDTKNMAKKIKCPVIMGIGLQDKICPPSTSFATFNRIESPKEYSVYKNSGHYQPNQHYDNRYQFLRKSFGMD